MHRAHVESIPLFEGVRRRRLGEVARLLDEVAVAPGRALTREGELGREFFVIVEGSAEVRRGDRLVGTLGPGDFCGELALLVGPTRSATVVATAPLRLLVAGRREFGALVGSFPTIGARVRGRAAARTASPHAPS